MAKVVALVPDLLFGSKVQSSFGAAGFECQLIGDPQAARAAAAESDLLVVDLTDADLGGSELVASMVAAGETGQLKTLGFFSHVEPHVREAALSAGFDLVVPRSRMNREGPQLAERLLAG
ncbi:MAG: hypothetical protein F2813_02625 [Actinobacteria bacterium]|uniref:Unannotated protein n=1 Tax=freshwater metagenome TaxID=449393 RepID=A0A6J5ZJB5_9ZZZZ|nr:hypothetical protein [Actinomycetota bacterium]